MPFTISLIIAPYHVGILDHRVGAGPKRILHNDLVPRLLALGNNIAVKVQTIDAVDDFEGEIGRSFEIIRRISHAVSRAVADDSFPIVLAGNCNAEVGVAAGLNSRDPSKSPPEIIWFDAHSDYDTPDEAVSGYFDGMGVSMLSGESWKALMATVPGHRPLGMENFVFVGVRDLSDGQRRKLEGSEARVVYGGVAEGSRRDFPGDLASVLGDGKDVKCSVHVDLDCLDTEIGMANEYAASGGMSEEDLRECLEIVGRRRVPVSLTVASFNPGLDGGDRIADVAVEAIVQFVRSVSK